MKSRKLRDKNFKVRNEDTSLQGAAAREANQEEIPKAMGTIQAKTSEGKCSRGYSCSFKHGLTGKKGEKQIPFHFR